MSRSIPFFIVLIIVLAACKATTESKPRVYHNDDFNWTINIPADFTPVSPDDWAKLQNRGTQAIENTFGEKVENQATTIFVFRNGDLNYLESNYQPFDPEVDGDYLQSCKDVREIVYETFTAQMAGVSIDSASSVEKVSGLEFQKFRTAIDLPNGMKISMLMYSRLFGKKEFSLNITYVDEEYGKKMIEAWLSSVFKK